MSDLVTSSSAQYLTFVAGTGGDADAVELRYEDENIWLTQKLMAELYDVSVAAINQHLKRLTEDGEIDPEAVIKKYLITASDGKHYSTKHYHLQATLAVGFKVENPRAVQFRRWAAQIVKDFTIQGWVMDVERPHMGLTSWANAPGGKIVRCDVSVAKNYLSQDEISFLNRIVQDRLFVSDFDRYLELAEAVDGLAVKGGDA